MRSSLPALACLACCAQDILIRPALKAGDQFELEVVRIREDSRRPQANGKSRTPVSVRVLEQSGSGWVLSWRYGETVIVNPANANNPVLASASRFVQDLDFQVSLDAEGAYKGLRNASDVTRQLEAMLSALLKNIGGGQAEATARQVLSPATLLNLATNDLQIYFNLNGVELAPGQAIRVPIKQPGPFGGEPVDSTFALHLINVGAASATLSSRTEYDPATLEGMLMALMQRAGMPADQVKGKLGMMHMGDEGRYVYDRRRGLMREVIVTRRTNLEGALKKLDGWEIRLIR